MFRLLARLGCLAAGLALASRLAAADTATDDVEVRRRIEAFYHAFAAKDLNAVVTTWTPNLPAKDAWKASLANIFAKSGPIRIVDVDYHRISYDGEWARVRLTVEMSCSDAETLGSYAGIDGKHSAYFYLRRHTTGWTISDYKTIPAEGASDRMLIAELLRYESVAERDRAIYLECKSGDENFRLRLKCFELCHDDAARRKFLRQDVYLQQSSAVRALNHLSFERYLKFRVDRGNARLLSEAEVLQRRAAEIAEFIDDPESSAWCAVQRAVIDGQRGKTSGAITTAEWARNEFQTLRLVDGEFAANIVLGRLQMTSEHTAEALAAFDTANRRLPEIAVPGNWTGKRSLESSPSLGMRFADRLAIRDRYNHIATKTEQAGDLAEALRYLRSLLAIEREVYGEWHEDVFSSLERGIRLCIALGNFESAKEWARQASRVAARLDPSPSFQLRHIDGYLQGLEMIGKGSHFDRRRYGDAYWLLSDGMRLSRDGKNSEALTKLQEATALIRESLGSEYAELSSFLYYCGVLHRRLSNLTEAIDCLMEAVEIRRRAFGEEGILQLRILIELAGLADDEAEKSLSDADLAAAAKRWKQVEAYCRRFPDEEMNPWKDQLFRSAHAAKHCGDIAKLSPADRRRYADARDRRREADRLVESDTSRSIELLLSSLPVYQAFFDPDGYDVFRIHVKLALAYLNSGKPAAAHSELQQLADIRRRLPYGPEEEDAYLAYLQGIADRQSGRLSAADENFQRARMLSHVLPAEIVTDLYGRMSRLAVDLGRFQEADSYLRTTILIKKRELLSPNDPDYFSHDVICSHAARFTDKQKLSQYCDLLFQMSDLAVARNYPESAVYYLDEAEWIVRRLGDEAGKNRLVKTLYMRAIVENHRHNYSEAERLLSEALAQSQESTVASKLNVRMLLIHVCLQLGHSTDASLHFAAAAKELQLLDDSESSSQTGQLAFYARLGARLGQTDSAIAALDRYFADERQRAKELFSVRAEAADSGETGDCLDLYLDLIAVRGYRQDEVDRTWQQILMFKARNLEMSARFREAQQLLANDPEAADLAAKLARVRQQAADLAIRPSGALNTWHDESHLRRYGEQIEELQAALNRRVQVKVEWPDVSPDEVRKQLKPGTAIVDFWLVRGNSMSTTSRYAAFVQHAGSKAVELVDLGDAAHIDELVRELRTQVARTPEHIKRAADKKAAEKALEDEYRFVAQDLFHAVYQPLLPALRGATRIYLSPDGLLNHVPFEALVAKDGRYLIETQEFAYLTGGRDLMRPTFQPGQGTVVFAGPKFGLPSERRQQLASELLAAIDRPRGSAFAGDVVRGGTWEDLEESRLEGTKIEETLRDTDYGPVRLYTGEQALEEVFKALRPPRVLHLATHGFFQEKGAGGMPARNASDLTAELVASQTLVRLRGVNNPLIRNGLIMAGANTLGSAIGVAPVGPTQPSLDDGWLTAEEISTVDLRGTELVVLSACDTGLGDLSRGEGIHGLRRAFLYAGAGTVVNSLFHVSDEATRKLMTTFYSRLIEGNGKLKALRDAEREVLEHRRAAQGAAHPYYWASFVLVGNPN